MMNLVLFTTVFKCRMQNMLYVVVVRCSSMYEAMQNMLYVVVVRCSSMYEAYCLLVHGKILAILR